MADYCINSISCFFQFPFFICAAAQKHNSFVSPAGQAKHAASPVFGEYFPGGQTDGYVDPSGHSVPSGQRPPIPKKVLSGPGAGVSTPTGMKPNCTTCNYFTYH